MPEPASKAPASPEIEWRFLGSASTQHAVRAYLEPDRGRHQSRRAVLACDREGKTWDIPTWTRRRDGKDPKCKRCERLAAALTERGDDP